MVNNLDDIRNQYHEMLASGFQPCGDYTGIGEEYFTKDNEQGMRLVSVHVLPKGHPEIRALINFRDYLITNEEDRNLYRTVKKELFAKHKGDYFAYDSSKEEIVKTIRQRADQWAKESSEL